MANTLNLGDGNWATKEDLLLGYNSENNNYKPLPFDFSRASSATRVNKDGLIETVGGGQARIDFKDDSKGSLLLEPSRSNLITYSDDFSQSTWQKQSAGVASAPIVTSNYAISPDGTLNADRVIFDINGGTTSSDFSQIADAITSSIGDVTNSVWIKSNTESNYNMSFVDPLANYTSIVVTTEWQRFDVTSTTVSTTSALRLRLRGNESTSDYADVSIWGAQIEQGSYATSYIPTQGSAVTRLADSCVGAGNEQVFNDSEGTFFVNFAADFNIYNSGLTDRGISINDGTNTNSARIFQATSLNNRIAYDLDTSSGTNQVFNTSTVFADITDFNKVAFTYKENEFKIFLNGVQQGSTDTNGSVFSNGTLNGISFDYGQEGNKPFFGRVKEVKYFNTALTDQELQALTTI